MNKAKIIILGDEQVQGFSTKLRNYRSQIENDIYTISSWVKPYATCEQVPSSCDNILQNLCNEDIIVLAVGSNDKNPYIVFSELCHALHKLKKYHVFVLNVNRNPRLNENLLNNK